MHIEGTLPRFSQVVCRGFSLTWFSTISPTRYHNFLAVAWHPSAYRAATASHTAAAVSTRLRYLIPDAVARCIFEDCLLSGHVRYRSMNARYRRGGRSARCAGRTLWTRRNCPAQSSATCEEESQAQTELKLEHNSQHRTQIDSNVRAVLHRGISAW